MKLQILSDLHIEFAPFDFPDTDADVVILAGDVQLSMKGLKWIQTYIPYKPVIYVLGNHEFYKTATPRLIQKLRKAAAQTNVHVLENEMFMIDNVCFCGCTLWTDFNAFGTQDRSIALAKLYMNDYKYIRKSPQFMKIMPSYTITWHRASLAFLSQQIELNKDKKIVIVTHHAPSLLSVPGLESNNPLLPAYVSDLDRFVEQSQACLWVHGHLHRAADYYIGHTHVICNPRGYPDEPVRGFRPDLMVEI